MGCRSGGKVVRYWGVSHFHRIHRFHPRASLGMAIQVT